MTAEDVMVAALADLARNATLMRQSGVKMYPVPIGFLEDACLLVVELRAKLVAAHMEINRLRHENADLLDKGEPGRN